MPEKNSATPSLRDHIEAYRRQNLALVPIPAGQKHPTAADWQYHPADYDYFLSHPHWNLGCIHWLSGTAVLDVDDVDATRTALAAVGMNLDLMLLDGSQTLGNPDRAKAWFTIAPHHIKKRSLRHPVKKTTVMELRGGKHQDVLPPSIHPDTGKPYRWLGKIPERFPEAPPSFLTLAWHWDDLIPRMLVALGATAPTPRPLSFIRPQQGRQPQKTSAVGGDDAQSVIDRFNALPNCLQDLLEKHGYHRDPRRPDRIRSPSSKGRGGITLIEAQDGTPLIYSYHGSGPLPAETPLSAFHLFRILEHAGDYRRAVRAAAVLLGIEHKKSPVDYGFDRAAYPELQTKTSL